MKLRPLMLMACCLVVIAGCGTHEKKAFEVPDFNAQAKPVDTLNFEEMSNLTASTSANIAQAQNAIRREGLKEAAMSVGAKSGLALRSQQINEFLNNDRQYLDQAFDFNLLVLEHNVLPPVLSEGDSTLNLENDTTIRVSDKTYHIIKQARFMTTAPNWREYLMMNFEKPKAPNPSILPRDKNEQKIWKENLRIGWQNGYQQANSIFSENMGRLKRDFSGMILYRHLLAQNMISAPYVAKTNLGVTGNSEEMNINDQILRITALPELQSHNSENWKPALNYDQPHEDLRLSK